MRFSVRFSGAGGHGIITASVVLADAAARAGFQVCQSQSYGPEARGGTAHADVIASASPILHPKIVSVDLLIALTQGGLDSFAGQIAQDATVILDETVVAGRAGCRLAVLPVLSQARERFGAEAFAGIISVGAALAVFRAIPSGQAEESIAARLPGKTVPANLEALRVGIGLAEKALGTPPAPPYEADL